MWIKQKIGYVVGQGSSQKELHREVVNALGVLAFISILGEHPTLRKDISHGTGGGFESLAQANLLFINDIVKLKMPFVQPVRSRKLNGAATVLFEKFSRFSPGRFCL